MTQQALFVFQNVNDPVNVDGVHRPSLRLAAIEVGLALVHDALRVRVYRVLERLVVPRALGPELPLEALLDGGHFDVMDFVPVAQLSRGSGRQGEVLILGDIRRDIRAEGHREVAPLALVAQPHDDDAGAVMLGHQLAAVSAQVEELLRNRHDLQARPLPMSRARIAAGPYRWLIFYALRHPVNRGG